MDTICCINNVYYKQIQKIINMNNKIKILRKLILKKRTFILLEKRTDNQLYPNNKESNSETNTSESISNKERGRTIIVHQNLYSKESTECIVE